MALKISICMPTYNYGQYLPEALDSVLAQDYPDFECIILDDCSTDDSARIIADYAKKDARIIAKINDRNLGMVNNWNRCLEMARGEYIKFLFGDDTLSSRSALSSMAAVLDSDPSVSLVASGRTAIDHLSRPVRQLPGYRQPGLSKGSDVIASCIVEQKNRIGEPSAVLFRRSQSVRGFDLRYRQIVDLEMWFHLLEQGSFFLIPEPLVSFRIHSQQQTRQNMLNIELIDEPFLLLREYGNKGYLRLARINREYMNYLPLYSVWKLYRQHRKIRKADAIALIEKKYPLAKFILLYPFFKLYKLYRRSNEGI